MCAARAGRSLLTRGLASLELRRLVLDISLEKLRISAHNAPAVHEHRGRAVHLELLTISAARVDGLASLQARQAGPEFLGSQSRVRRVLVHLIPGVGGGNHVLM